MWIGKIKVINIITPKSKTFLSLSLLFKVFQMSPSVPLPCIDSSTMLPSPSQAFIISIFVSMNYAYMQINYLVNLYLPFTTFPLRLICLLHASIYLDLLCQFILFIRRCVNNKSLIVIGRM